MKRLVYLLVRLRQRRIDNAKISIEPPTAIQSIWEQARVNGGDSLVDAGGSKWEFPAETWLSQRRELIRRATCDSNKRVK